MTFVDRLLNQLATAKDQPMVTEVRGEALHSATGHQVAQLAARARQSLRTRGVSPGERVALISDNGIQWVAADLGILAEGAIAVPLYARQDPNELATMLADCEPAVVWVSTEALQQALVAAGVGAPVERLDDVFAAEPLEAPVHAWKPDDGCTIVYTSGTSGAAKGAVLAVKGVDYMLPVTASALEDMMALGEPVGAQHRVFHYLPFCFAGSRIVLWTCLFRGNEIMVSTDLDDLARELSTAAPHYVLNVPMLLERIKNRVEKGIREAAAPIQWLYDAAQRIVRIPPSLRRRRERALMWTAERVLFARLRQRIGPNLRCLICGSAPLGEDTQRWFELLGIPVYQVYGLTETTAIVTMDTPPTVKPGRVGTVLNGVETRITEEGELQVRGPNVFSHYWNCPDATEAAFEDGWFRTGDQVEVDDEGFHRIVGRVKNLLVPSSGHNVAPEPIEQRIIETIEGVEQAVVVGHGRPFLSAIIAGETSPDVVQRGMNALNEQLPHYRRIRTFHLAAQPFTIENGLLTANRKLKRTAIEHAYASQIETMYAN